MKAPPFHYHAPKTLAEALELLGSLENARVLAGGQSLMPMLNLRLAAPDHLIDLGEISGLRGVVETETHLSIGAMTTQRGIEKSEAVAIACPLLKLAIDHVGHQQTRNRGTIGGSLCHFDPGAELPVAMMALDAELTVANPRGFRVLAFDEFPEGYLTTALRPGEILTHIAIPKRGAREGSAFLEFNLRPADFAVVSVAARISLDEHGRIAGAAIAIGGVRFAPIRLHEAEARMLGHAPARNVIAAAAAEAAALNCDGDDVHPADFRAELCGALTRRALTAAAARAMESADV